MSKQTANMKCHARKVIGVTERDHSLVDIRWRDQLQEKAHRVVRVVVKRGGYVYEGADVVCPVHGRRATS